jgi:hypothetical protein
MKNIFCWKFWKIIINTNINLLLLLFFFIISRFGFILNNLPSKWYKVPTMLLEKVSIHTEILFVHCYKFFFLLLVLFLFVENCWKLYIIAKRYKWICCVPVYCTFMVVIVYPFTQIFIIGHKGKFFFPEQKFCFRVHLFSVTKM